MSPESQAEEKLRSLISQPWFMGGLEDVAREALKETGRPIYLTLNADNALVQKLVSMDRRNDKMINEVVLGIYNRLYFIQIICSQIATRKASTLK